MPVCSLVWIERIVGNFEAPGANYLHGVHSVAETPIHLCETDLEIVAPIPRIGTLMSRHAVSRRD
jgi:hypothetical protein